MKIKKADVAALFYPDDALELKELVEEYLQKAKPAPFLTRAIIAPHAGYIYSGPIAGAAYKALYSSKDQIQTIIILSPAHHYSFEGVALHSAEGFSTPLGTAIVDQELKEKLKSLSFIQELDEAFYKEHAVEVHLPFIQHIFPQAKILPMIVGYSKPEEIEKIFELCWPNTHYAFVLSTDLSHFLPYTQAQKMDALTARQIEKHLYQEIEHEQCCGFFPLRGLLKFAKTKKLKIGTLDLRNSADTAGDKSKVVGYGAFAIQS